MYLFQSTPPWTSTIPPFIAILCLARVATLKAIQQLGYDGAWFDSYSPSTVANDAGAGGEKVAFWNFDTNQHYTVSD
jgi:hypothetical protein